MNLRTQMRRDRVKGEASQPLEKQDVLEHREATRDVAKHG